MRSNEKLKEIGIKNPTCYYLGDIKLQILILKIL